MCVCEFVFKDVFIQTYDYKSAGDLYKPVHFAFFVHSQTCRIFTRASPAEKMSRNERPGGESKQAGPADASLPPQLFSQTA